MFNERVGKPYPFYDSAKEMVISGIFDDRAPEATGEDVLLERDDEFVLVSHARQKSFVERFDGSRIDDADA